MSVSDPTTEYSEPDNEPGSDATYLTSVRNGLVGGVVAVLLSMLPLSTVLGGGVAGYLERKNGRRGPAAGAVAGVVAFVPYLVGGLYLVVADVALPGPALSVSPTVLVVGVTAFALVYAVGLAVLGSFVGGYLHDEL